MYETLAKSKLIIIPSITVLIFFIIEKFYSFRKIKLFKIGREWLAFSNIQGTVYCHACWLFGHKAAKNMRYPWINGFVPDAKHLK